MIRILSDGSGMICGDAGKLAGRVDIRRMLDGRELLSSAYCCVAILLPDDSLSSSDIN